MRLSNWMILAMLTILSMVASGCEVMNMFRERPVYVGAGQYAEIAKPVNVPCWVTNKATGKRELRTVKAQAGWLVGRQKGSPASVANGDDITY